MWTRSLFALFLITHATVIKIVRRDWIPADEEPGTEEYDDDEEFPDEADIWPEIEGCTEKDVGWTKAARGIVAGDYVNLCNPEFWYKFYKRPPERAQ